MRKLIIISILYFTSNQIIAQRNPNTNSRRIKKDTTLINPTNIDTVPEFYKSNSEPSVFKNANQPNDLNEQNVLFGAYLNYGTSNLNIAQLEDGFGFSFKLGYDLLNSINSPLALYAGLGFDYLYFGGKKIEKANDVTLAINSNAYGWYPFVDLDIGKNWPITFFGTAYWGGRIFYTRQNINYTDASNTRQKDTKNIEGDGTNIYGYGGGLKLGVSDHIRLELRYQKNFGNNVVVIDPNTIEFLPNGNLDSYKMTGVDSDLDIYYFGLVLNF